MRILLFGLALLMSGCATNYQPKGFTGGFSETRLAPDMFQVRFRGNGHTSSERAEDFALLRAADLSSENGYPYFSIVNQSSDVSHSAIQTAGQSFTSLQSTGGGGYVGSTTYIPGQNINIYRPRAGLLIKCFREKPTGIDTFSAPFLRNELRRKYGLDH